MTRMGAFCVFVSLATESSVFSSIENERRKQLFYFGYCYCSCCCRCRCYYWYYQMDFVVCIVENCKLCLSLQTFHKMYNCNSNKSDQIQLTLSLSRSQIPCICLSKFGCHLTWMKYPNALHISGCVDVWEAVAHTIGLSSKKRTAGSAPKKASVRWNGQGYLQW